MKDDKCISKRELSLMGIPGEYGAAGVTKAKTGKTKEQKGTLEDVRKYMATEKQPRPFRIVEFGCRCSCRHFNSGECIICILAVRPLRAGTMSPGSNGHRRISPTVRQMRTVRCRALFLAFLASSHSRYG